jgi:type VI secretion system protein ImpF
MAELTVRERRQPSLLDRLTDDEPTVKLESRDRRIMSPQQLRRSVLRDLAWLMNTSTRFSPEELKEFPLVAASVLNYGIADLCGLTGSSVDAPLVERMVQAAVKRFEPRILPASLSVRASADAEAMSPNALSFEIKGSLWAQPMPERLYVKTEVDLETGQCLVQDRPDG